MAILCVLVDTQARGELETTQTRVPLGHLMFAASRTKAKPFHTVDSSCLIDGEAANG